MTEDELIREIQLKNQLSELDGSPVPEYDPSDGMETVEELKKYTRFLYAALQEKDMENQQMRKDMAEIKEELKAANRRADEEAAGRKRLFDKLEDFMDGQKSADDEKKQLLRKIETLENRLAMANQALYGGSKTCSDKYSGQKNEGINDGRDDFDGTEKSLPDGTPGPVSKAFSSCDGASRDENSDDNTQNAGQENEEQQTCYHGPSRKGCTYVKEVIGEPIEHECIIPEGCKVIKVKKPRKVKTIVQRLEEHHFQRVLVEYPDGTRKTITAPADEEGKEILEELVPGTGITATLLSFMIFNRYIMASPAYREAKNRYPDMDWHTCRQNLLNWEDKGAIMLSMLLPALKDIALEEGANVNVDETWYRYLAKGEEYFPDKVWRALNYFHNFWDQIFAYRNDGEYSIDNMAVERAIRPLTVQRKNGLFFCSSKGARNSGIYNTFISTCQQKCRNFRDFFVDYVREWNRGRRDFGRSSLARLPLKGRKNLVRLAFAPSTY